MKHPFANPAFGWAVPFVLVVSAGLASPSLADVTQATRGLAARVTVTYPQRLQPKGDQTVRSLVRVRVEPGEAPGTQVIEFIGNQAGDFDLRDYLQREDGGAITDLSALPIHVVSRLPGGHGSDLFGNDDMPSLTGGGYQAILIALAAAWVLVPVVVFTRRALRAKPAPVVVIAPPRQPTLAERIGHAIASAKGRQMSAEERAGLELMVIRYLCERTGRAMVPQEDHALTLETLRTDARTRTVVLAVERWLHAGSDPAQRERDAAAAFDAIAQLERHPPASPALSNNHVEVPV
ncbi:MAG: hypothetical protein WC718_07570 [Phycisphaerales bacterium]|jgi:hypothetical protein